MNYLSSTSELIDKYLIYSLGIVGFVSMMLLGIIGLIVHQFDITKYLPYGFIIFVINLIYLKTIRLSREDYEKAINAEKEYSKELLVKQKEFLRYVIHETNTPLAGIMANLDLYELEFGKHAYLSNIESAAKNIYGLYDDLSYLTQKNRINYPKQEMNLKNFLKRRVAFFDIVAAQSQKSIITSYKTSNKPIIYINETKLQRIIDNNITNAIKYTKESYPIYISLTQTDSTFVLEFYSHSLKIKHIEKIFDPYYREGKSKEGLGLGLNLVQQICQEEQIDIDLQSQDNQTSFKYAFKKELA